MKSLSGLERMVLEKFLQGDHPTLNTLRAQLSSVKVANREHTGSGFFSELHVADGAPCAPIMGREHISDVVGKTESLELGLGFVLFIEDGRLSLLEGHTYGENLPIGPISLTELDYEEEPRQLSGLKGA